jgi:tetratricopeptide (TPR) repeat protein
VADNPRIDELRRRVQKDPASIAFAQLAEEFRRAGSHEDAIATCRAGLAIHPGYLSARVTLGRALIEVNDLDAAQAELEFVLKSATENLAAIRGVAEIHHRRGELSEALGYYKTALALAKHDPDLEQTVDEISRAISPAQSVTDDGLSFEQASAEFLAALEDLPGGLDAALAPPEPMGLPRLERFLDAIHTYRQKKAV